MFFFLFFFCNEYVFLWLFLGIFLSLPISLSFFYGEQKRYEFVCFGNLGVKIVGSFYSGYVFCYCDWIWNF